MQRRKRSEAERNATKMIIITGCLTLGVLVFIPMWNSRYLWQDPIYSYFSGTWVPRGVFVCCAAIWVIGFLTINMFFVRVPFEAHTESTLLSLATIFLTLIGVVLTLYSQPLTKQASSAYMELWSNCQFGVGSRPLWAVYSQLNTIRSTPECLEKTSIVSCANFKDYPYLKEAELLKNMESILKCSGFCYTPDAANGTAFPPYPPTLFSKDNYQVSCDGAAARHVRFFVASSANSFMLEGVFLILVAVAVGLLKLVTYCRSLGRAPPPGHEINFYEGDPIATATAEKRVIYQEDPRIAERRYAYGAL